MLQAPLLLGCDVGNLTAETMPIIGNEEVIVVNQGIISSAMLVSLILDDYQQSSNIFTYEFTEF